MKDFKDLCTLYKIKTVHLPRFHIESGIKSRWEKPKSSVLRRLWDTIY